MALEKMAILACGFLPAGLLVCAGIVIGRESGAGAQPQAAGASAHGKPGSPPVASRVEEPPDPVDPLVRQLLKASRPGSRLRVSITRRGGSPSTGW